VTNGEIAHIAADEVTWDLCGEEECIGVPLDSGVCLRHLWDTDPEAAAATLDQAYSEGSLDARGVEVSAGLFKAILERAPGSDDRPVLPRVDFERAHFTSSVRWEGVDFDDDARFVGATFAGDTSFAASTFRRLASFQGARFERSVAFDTTRFERTGLFEDLTVGGDVSMARTSFAGSASFRRSRFASVEISEVAFLRSADFTQANFKGVRIAPILSVGDLLLEDVDVEGRFTLEAAGTAIVLRHARFGEPATIEARWADIALEHVDFMRPSVVTRLPTPVLVGDGTETFTEDAVSARVEPEPAGIRRAVPRVVSLDRSDVEHLTLGDVNLHNCRFFGSHNLHKLVIEAPDALPPAPDRVLWTRRRTVAEEHEWRALDTRRLAKGWYGAPTRPPTWLTVRPRSPREIATTYRALRRGREENKDEPGAADLYYGEMEMRRAVGQRGPVEPGSDTPDTPRAERIVLWAYWLLSGYGLRANRAFRALAVAVALSAALFYLYGFQDRHHPFARPQDAKVSKRLPFPPPAKAVGEALTSVDAWTYSVGTATSIIGAPESQLTTDGRVVRVVLRILGPLLIGLGLLAIRARVRR
jgi:uncharacterized protein YjbI with pentapeptide repeats